MDLSAYLEAVGAWGKKLDKTRLSISSDKTRKEVLEMTNSDYAEYF